jgi:uncharacterized protein YqgV (UPF0045/DUF77 family)
MRPVEETVSCEVAFLPIGEGDYGGEVDEVLALIENSGLEHSAGPMSTFVRGDRAAVWALLSGIDAAMSNRCRFVMDIRFSNVCGCE